MPEFTLRAMEPADGPAIDVLMRNEALTTPVALTTRYLHDIYEALLAQYPSLFGVVATMSGSQELVGMATAYLDEVSVNGRPRRSAHLANLKVRGDIRRQGLGGRLAAWRIEEARRRFGDEGVIVTEVEAGNAPSLATARRWSTQILGPVRVVIARVTNRRPNSTAMQVRPMAAGDVQAVVAGVNAFFAGYQLFPQQTEQKLAAFLAPTTIGVIRQYRVAVGSDGTILAGAAVSERFRVMEDHIDRIPPPLALLSRIVPILPPDRVIRTIELSLAWHKPDRVDALRLLWDAIRYEWRNLATHVAGQADPRGSLIDAFHVGPTMIPRVQLMAPVQSPEPFDEDRPVYLWR
jgi:predicted N-acetyltransferase YhbS